MWNTAPATDGVAVASSLEEPREPLPQPWGPWASLGLTAVIAVAFVVVQYAALIVLGVIEVLRTGTTDPGPVVEALSQSGFFLAVATCVTAILCTPLILLFIRIRGVASAKTYLSLKAASRPEWIWWFLALLGLEALSIVAMVVFDQPDVPDFMITAYATSRSLPLLWFALVVAAPVFEEALFRGFLFEGLQHSQIGPWGAVILTSLVWTSIHLQYDFFDLANIFALGVLLGAARAKTGSLYLTIVLHAVVNTLAMVNVILFSP